MRRMSMIWRWSSQEFGTSSTRSRVALRVLNTPFGLTPCALHGIIERNLR
jgi:hypothetical protein